MATLEATAPRAYTTYRISVDQYTSFRERGFLVVKGLVPPEDVQELNAHMDDMRAGRVFNDESVKIHGFGVKPHERLTAARVHMLHRVSEIHERFLLHPRLLDVLAALIGPDVLALQSMLFFKDPGQVGQGYHQDSYYIPTFPDTLCGAWLALTPATVANGCVWYATGSQHEPVYPDPRGMGAALNTNIGDLGTIDNASSMDESANGLNRVVKKYSGRAEPALAEPGDVVFFGGHIVHWSYNNESNLPRRAYVGHYCNARSFVPWNYGQPYEGDSGNYLHILARGSTHLPYAQPLFGTPCAANAPRPAADGNGARPQSMMPTDDGMMSAMPHMGGMDME
jgi:ectoine hydroxylase-related dioxygenase (phytanoyl-CoA dioxygenase family)